MSREVCGICWCPYDDITGDCACPPVSVQKSTLREAAQQALEALDWHSRHGANWSGIDEATEALRAALAEPPTNPAPGYCKHCKQYTIEEPLPAEPVQERKPLSEEEIEKAYRHIWRSLPDDFDHTTASWIEQGIRYAERAHGIK